MPPPSPLELAGAATQRRSPNLVVTRGMVMLERRLALDPQVALRPEPFGALAYHYGNRRLIFLKHPDVVRVVRALGEHESVAATLAACEIAESRWPSFVSALESLERSHLLRDAA